MPSLVGPSLRRSQYRLLGLVGQGQFGRVYCAVHRQTGRLVALKNLEQQRFPTHKFLRELRFLLSLQHPNIVTCRSIEHTRTGRYLVMDYCEGDTLRGLMEGEGRLHPAHCLKLAINILEGLEHAHSRGIVHCDIKPENILLSVQSDGWIARITDFGIARLRQELAEPQSGSNTGSPAYMAPERFYGQYSPTSDLYSVGILLYELLSGDRPFSGTPTEIRSAHLNQPLTFPDRIPQPWRPILATALQKLAGRRFRTASEMLAAVKQLNLDIGEPSLNGSCSNGVIIGPQTPLLIPEPLASSPVITHHQTTLGAPIYTISPVSSGTGELPSTLEIYCARQDQVVRQRVGSHLGDSEQSAQIGSPVQSLHTCDRGCLAVTEAAVYLLFRSPTRELSTHLVAELIPGSVVAARGRWVAIASVAENSPMTMLDVLPLWGGGGRRLGMPLSNEGRPLQNTQLIWLDPRHLAVVQHDGQDREAASGRWRTRIEILTRRGHRFGRFNLPIHLSQVTVTPVPHRLLAVDAADPFCMLLIDLMPYRVRRIGLEIIPHCLTPTPWGSAIADANGTIVLLDHQGQRLARLESGLPTASILSLHPQWLAVATEGETPELHLLDLTQPGLALMF